MSLPTASNLGLKVLECPLVLLQRVERALHLSKVHPQFGFTVNEAVTFPFDAGFGAGYGRVDCSGPRGNNPANLDIWSRKLIEFKSDSGVDYLVKIRVGSE